jgi:hypothetical protein
MGYNNSMRGYIVEQGMDGLQPSLKFGSSREDEESSSGTIHKKHMTQKSERDEGKA